MSWERGEKVSSLLIAFGGSHFAFSVFFLFAALRIFLCIVCVTITVVPGTASSTSPPSSLKDG